MEWDRIVMEARRLYEDFAAFCYDNQPLVALAIAVWLLYAAALLHKKKRRQWKRWTRKTFNIRRGNEMRKGERKDLVRIRIADAITSGIEDAVAEGLLTSIDASKAYKKLAYFFKHDDYLPGCRSPLTAHEYETVMSMLFKKTRAPIPGVKPGEVDNVHVYAKKDKRTFGDKVRRRN